MISPVWRQGKERRSLRRGPRVRIEGYVGGKTGSICHFAFSLVL